MKNNLKKISALILASALVAPTAFAQTKTLEERVSELEAGNSLNIFTFSGTYTTRMDDIISAKQTQGTTTPTDMTDTDYLRMKFQFNIDANVSKYIKFYSRLTTSKNFNSYYQQGRGTGNASDSSTDLTSANDYKTTNVVLEKAYMDITIPDTNFTLSIGRLPTVDGDPQNYKDGRARMGTYPQLSYDSPLDGFAVSYKADDWLPKDNKLALRLLYTPFSQYNLSSYTTQPTTQATVTPQKLNNQVATEAAMVDYSLDNMSWFDNMSLGVMYFQTGDLYISAAAPVTPLDSTLGIAVGGTTLTAEFNGIGHSNFDLSANYLFSTLKSSGRYSSGLPVGFGTNSGSSDTSTGGILLLSGRYRLGTWIFGGEYVNGSEDSFYYAANEEDITNFYSTHGDAYHLYVTKKFMNNLSLRVGWMDQEYKWTATSVGANKDSDRKVQTAYANLRLDF